MSSSSTCKIERVDTTDTAPWVTVYQALRQMSASEYGGQVRGLDLLFCSLHPDQQALSSVVKNFGNQGRYGDGL